LQCIEDALGAAGECLICVCDILDIIGGGDGICGPGQEQIIQKKPARFAKLIPKKQVLKFLKSFSLFTFHFSLSDPSRFKISVFEFPAACGVE
jgi:hypothetical protein